MSFVKIEPGVFSMGEEKGSHDDEPVHQVALSRPFCVGRYEVTQRQWIQIMGSNPSSFVDMELPVHKVSWEGAKEFIAKLNEGERGRPYRLATEAEWEYAARAGKPTRYSFGDDPSLLSLYGNCLSRDSIDRFDRPAPFGSFKANPWGLCDMYGNVWEWVGDWSGDYLPGAVRDPGGPSRGSRRVRRGGSWESRAENCRSATRNSSKPGTRDQEIGFRIVRDPMSL
jgi:formylglycine-generating enzyme required for sulfatase activity